MPDSQPAALRLDREALQDFLAREFPQMAPYGLRIEAVAPGSLRMRLPIADRHLRPGGTVSGPAMMTLVDCSTYLCILAMLGPVALAVTTNLSINFLRRPLPADLVAEVALLKLGRRLAVAEVRIYSDGEPAPVAHATLTYSIPSKKS